MCLDQRSSSTTSTNYPQGGGLANPAQQFPRIFGGIYLWEEFPYALSTFTTGVVVLSAAILSIFYLQETLKRKDPGSNTNESSLTTWQVLKAPGVPIVLYIYGHVMLLAGMFTAVSTVVMYTSVDLGGFGLSDQQIAGNLVIIGASQAVWSLIAFPRLQRRFGTGTVMRWCAFAWPFFMASYPVLNETLRQGWVLAFWIAAPIGFVLGSGVAMGFCESTKQ